MMIKEKYILILAVCYVSLVTSFDIELAICQPPDYPEWGGYEPKQDNYTVGDFIHYYCQTDTYIGGDYYRICEDNGLWTGETPVCDESTKFSSVTQTSTAHPVGKNGAELVRDDKRSTCSSTTGVRGAYWKGVFENAGELLRVMVFMPKGEVAYDVRLLKRNGSELSCGSRRKTIDRLDWDFHNCPGPHNLDAVGIKIVSLSSKPLQICEIRAHVLTPPTCVDPRLHIDGGHLQISRKRATLFCKKNYIRSPQTQLQCVRTGVWNGTIFYCEEPQFDDATTEAVVAGAVGIPDFSIFN